MAVDKKKIVVYADWIDAFEYLTDDEAGKLIKHFFRYVNDKNPVLEDRLLKASWIPIEKTLKRDLKKWSDNSGYRSDKARKAGLASAEARRLKSELNSTTELKPELNSTKSTVSVNDSVSVSVNDNVKENINKTFSFRKSMCALGLEKSLVDDFLKNRKLKRLANTETAFNNLVIEFNKNEIPMKELMTKIVSSGWGSFKNSWLEEEKNKKVEPERSSAVQKKVARYDG